MFVWINLKQKGGEKKERKKKKRNPRQGLEPCVIGLTALDLNSYTSWSRTNSVVTDMALWVQCVMKAPSLVFTFCC